MSFSQDETWAARALCAGQEPDALFVQGAAQDKFAPVVSRVQSVWNAWPLLYNRKLTTGCGVASLKWNVARCCATTRT